MVERPDTKVGHLDHNLSTRKTSETPLEDDEELGNSSTSLEANANQGRKHNNPFVRLLLKITKRNELELEKKKEAVTLEMLQPSRYKPNDLEQMAEETKFTKSMIPKKCLKTLKCIQINDDRELLSFPLQLSIY